MRHTWIAILILALPLFGQLDSNTISITASRSVLLQPDQVSFSIQAGSPTGASLDDVLAALQGSVTAVDRPNPLAQSLTLSVPVAKMSETIAALLQLKVNFSVTGTEPSKLPACLQADLVADATAKARVLASAAGLIVGRVLSVSDSPTVQVPALIMIATLSSSSQLSGDFSRYPGPGNIIPAGSISLRPLLPSPAATCALTVKFALGPGAPPAPITGR
jgi:hypothetical protein